MGLKQDGYEGAPQVVQDTDPGSPLQQKSRGNGLAALANKLNRGDLDTESFLAAQNE
jgi:hypothetical protein